MNTYLKITAGALTIAILLLFACKTEGELFVTGISLNKTTLSLEIGNNETLIAKITPEKATNKAISWSSSNNSVVTVNASGKLTAVSVGTATITVTTQNGGKKTTCYVTVIAPFVPVRPFVPVTNITGVPTTAIAETPLTLTGTVVPSNATNKTITWSVVNAGTTGATISGNTLNTTAAGMVQVRATVVNGASETTNYTQDFIITVNKNFVPVTAITDVPSTTKTGTPLTLTGVVVPSNASNKTISWSVEYAGSTGATISGSSILNTAAAGYLVIYATIKDGLGTNVNYIQEFIINVELSGVWTKKADLTGGIRAGSVGFSIGNKGYIGTGNDNKYKDFWEYNPVLNTWVQKADFAGGPRVDAVGFSIGNKGYIGIGTDGYNFYKDFWEYDPILNTWTRKADFAGGIRANAVGFSIGIKGYIGTGWDGVNEFQDFWEYDPESDRWTKKANFPGESRRLAVGFSIGNKGYVGTAGSREHGGCQDFWEYDPVFNNWTQKANVPDGCRASAVGFSIGKKGYIGTGYDWGRRDFWEYDPVSNTWTQKADYTGGGREAAVGFSIGNKGYMGTGFTYDGGAQVKQDFWEFTP